MRAGHLAVPGLWGGDPACCGGTNCFRAGLVVVGGGASIAEVEPWLLGWSGLGAGQFMLRVAVVTEDCTLGGSFRMDLD